MKAITAILALIVAVAGSAFARDQESRDVKDKMKVSDEKMGELLGLLLVDEGWEIIIKDAQHLVEHAQMIQALDPSEYTKGMPKGEYFQTYAMHLESSSRNLKVVAQEIEAERAAGAKRSRFLRPNAAVFFGQAVSMCVNCHSQFRVK